MSEQNDWQKELIQRLTKIETENRILHKVHESRGKETTEKIKCVIAKIDDTKSILNGLPCELYQSKVKDLTSRFNWIVGIWITVFGGIAYVLFEHILKGH